MFFKLLFHGNTIRILVKENESLSTKKKKTIEVTDGKKDKSKKKKVENRMVTDCIGWP